MPTAETEASAQKSSPHLAAGELTRLFADIVDKKASHIALEKSETADIEDWV
jgi:hypothetical protein